MKSLKEELKSLGGDLLVMDVGPDQAINHLFKKLEKNGRDLPSSFSWNRDYEPFARERDERIENLLSKFGVEVFHERDHIIIEPWELEKDKGAGYQVYTPFSRKWLTIFQQKEFQDRLIPFRNSFKYLRKLRKGEEEKIFDLTWKKVLGSKIEIEDHLDRFDNKNRKKVTIEIPKAGSLAAFDALENFKSRLDEYGDKRDIPSINGTSRLSMFLKMEV